MPALYKIPQSKSVQDFVNNLKATSLPIPPIDCSVVVNDQRLPTLNPTVDSFTRSFLDNLEASGCLLDSKDSALSVVGSSTIYADHPWRSVGDVDFAITVKMRSGVFKTPLHCLSRALIEPFKAELRKSNIKILDLMLASLASQPHRRYKLDSLFHCMSDAILSYCIIQWQVPNPTNDPEQFKKNLQIQGLHYALSNSSMNLETYRHFLEQFECIFPKNEFVRKNSESLARGARYKSEDEFLEHFIGKYYIGFKRIIDWDEKDRDHNIINLMLKFGLYNFRLINHKYLYSPKAKVSTSALEGSYIDLHGGHVRVIIGSDPAKEFQAQEIDRVFKGIIYDPMNRGFENLSLRGVHNITHGAVMPYYDEFSQVTLLAEVFENLNFMYKFISFCTSHYSTMVVFEHERKAYSSSDVDVNGAPVAWSRVGKMAYWINWIYFLESSPCEMEKQKNDILQEMAEKWVESGGFQGLARVLTKHPEKSSAALAAIHGELFCALQSNIGVDFRGFEGVAPLYGTRDWSFSILVEGKAFFIKVKPQSIARFALEHLKVLKWQEENDVSLLSSVGFSQLSAEECIEAWLKILANPPKIAVELQTAHAAASFDYYHAEFLRLLKREFLHCVSARVLSQLIDSPYFIALQEPLLHTVCSLYPHRKKEWDELRTQLLIRELNNSQSASMTGGSVVVLRKILEQPPTAMLVRQLATHLPRTLDIFQFYAVPGLREYVRSLYPAFPEEWRILRRLILPFEMGGYAEYEGIGPVATTMAILLQETDPKTIFERLHHLVKMLENRDVLVAAFSNSHFRDVFIESLLSIIQRHISDDPPSTVNVINQLIINAGKISGCFTPQLTEFARIISLQHRVRDKTLEAMIERQLHHIGCNDWSLFEKGTRDVLSYVVGVIKTFSDRFADGSVTKEDFLRVVITGLHIAAHSSDFPILYDDIQRQFARLFNFVDVKVEDMFRFSECEEAVHRLFVRQKESDRSGGYRFYTLAQDILFTRHHSLGIFILRSLCEGKRKTSLELEQLLLEGLRSPTLDSATFLWRLEALKDFNTNFKEMWDSLKTVVPDSPGTKIPATAIEYVNKRQGELEREHLCTHDFEGSFQNWMKTADSLMTSKSVNNKEAIRMFQEAKVYLEHLQKENGKCPSAFLNSILNKVKGLLSHVSEADVKLWSEEFDQIIRLLAVEVPVGSIETLVEFESLIAVAVSKRLLSSEESNGTYMSFVARYRQLKILLPITLVKWEIGFHQTLLASPTCGSKPEIFRTLCAELKHCASVNDEELHTLVIRTIEEQMNRLSLAGWNALSETQMLDLVALLKAVFTLWGGGRERRDRELDALIEVLISSPICSWLRKREYAICDGIVRTNGPSFVKFVAVIVRDDVLNIELALDFLKNLAEKPTPDGTYSEQVCFIVNKFQEDQPNFGRAFRLGLSYFSKLFFLAGKSKQATASGRLMGYCEGAIPGLCRLPPVDQNALCRDIVNLLVPPHSNGLLSQTCDFVVRWNSSHKPLSCEPILIKIKEMDEKEFPEYFPLLKKLISALSLAPESRDLTLALALIKKIIELPHTFDNWTFCLNAFQEIAKRFFAFTDTSRAHLAKIVEMRLAVDPFHRSFVRHLESLKLDLKPDPSLKSSIVRKFEQLIALYTIVGNTVVGLEQLVKIVNDPGVAPQISYELCNRLLKMDKVPTSDEALWNRQYAVGKQLGVAVMSIANEVFACEVFASPKVPLSFMELSTIDIELFVKFITLRHRPQFITGIAAGDMGRYESFKKYFFQVFEDKRFLPNQVFAVNTCCRRLLTGSAILVEMKAYCEGELKKAGKSPSLWRKDFFERLRVKKSGGLMVDFINKKFHQRNTVNIFHYNKAFQALVGNEKYFVADNPEENSMRNVEKRNIYLLKFLGSVAPCEDDFTTEALEQGPAEALRFLEFYMTLGSGFLLKSFKSPGDKLKVLGDIIAVVFDLKMHFMSAIGDYKDLERYMLELEVIVNKWAVINESELEGLSKSLKGKDLWEVFAAQKALLDMMLDQPVGEPFPAGA